MRLPHAIAAALEAGGTVIASSARAARALRRLHAEEQRRQGLAAWQTADILGWDGWLDRWWQKRLRAGNERRLLLTALQEQQVWVRLVKPSIEGRRLISIQGVAELAQQAYALLCEYQALDFLRGERLGGPDVESFREWARGFERECRKEEWLSRSLLPLVLRDAVLAGQIEATERLVLTGFDRITPAQQSLIEALREQRHQVERYESTEVDGVESAWLVKAVDKRDEIVTCALWVRRELEVLGQTARIAVVVPGVSSVRPEIERIFRQTLAPEAVAIRARDLPLDFEFSLGVPLADVPMARAALLLLRWMNEALLQDQLSWLILSGFVCEHQDELLPIAEFDARLRRQPMRQPEQDLDAFLLFLSEGWREATPLAALRRRLQAGRRMLLRSGTEALSFAEWVNLAQRILEAVHWPGAHLLQDEDFQVEAKWSQLLDSVAALSFDGRKVGYAEFIEVMQRQAGQMIFAPESRNAAVQILGPLEAAGLTFDALWFLGADDAGWPAVASPHPFLTGSLQRKHSMPHADSAGDWKLAEQVTTRLKRSAAKCVFSYPSQNAEGACRPSTLVSSGTQEIKASSLRASLGAGESLSGDFPIVLTEEEQAAIVPWPIEQDAGGSETLKRQAACPFQSFAAKRLAARPMDATDWGLEPRERGQVVHKILEGVWAELKSLDGLLEARGEARLPEIVARQVKTSLQRYGNPLHAQKHSWSRAYLDAEEERITSLIEEWLAYEEKRAQFTVEAGERKLPATVGDLKLQVRVDRIDAVRAGRVIIDYKTGVVKADAWEGARPDEPQLPLYAGYGQVDDLKGVLLGRVREGEVKFIGRVADGNAVMPGDGKLSKILYSAKMLDGWQKVLLDLGQQFLDGEAQVDPKQYPKTCEFCPLPGLCRIAESDRANADDEADEGNGEPID